MRCTCKMRVVGWAMACLLLVALSVSGQSTPNTAGEKVARAFQELSAATSWRRVDEFEMQFDTFHPQGMAVIGDRIYVSSVEVVDRRAERGRGHLFEADMTGTLLRQIELGEGPAYHAGGIDFDGTSIWVPVAEYKPDSRTIVYRVDPATMSAEKVFTFADHLGGIVRDAAANALIGNSWGSRRFYRWELEPVEADPRPKSAGAPLMRPNPSHYVDFQDGQWLPGTHLMLCSGLKGYRVPARRGDSFTLGGMALVDTRTLGIVHEVPIALWTEGGRPMTQNPCYAVPGDGGLRLYFMPEDNRSTVYVYEPRKR